MDYLVVIAIVAVPVAGLGALALLLDRWGRKHDPMGGTIRNILPIDGEAKRGERYRE